MAIVEQSVTLNAAAQMGWAIFHCTLAAVNNSKPDEPSFEDSAVLFR